MQCTHAALIHWLSHRLVDWMIDWFLCRTWSLCARVDIWWWFLIIGWRNRSRFHSKKAFRCWAIMNEALLFLQPICPDSGWDTLNSTCSILSTSYDFIWTPHSKVHPFGVLWLLVRPIVLLAKQDFDWMKLMPQKRIAEAEDLSNFFFCKTLLPFLSIFQTFVNESIPDPGWVRGSKLHSSRNFESAETSLWGLCCFPHLQICFHYSITFVNIHKLPWGTWSFATLQDPWKHSDFDRMLIWSAGE